MLYSDSNRFDAVRALGDAANPDDAETIRVLAGLMTAERAAEELGGIHVAMHALRQVCYGGGIRFASLWEINLHNLHIKQV